MVKVFDAKFFPSATIFAWERRLFLDRNADDFGESYELASVSVFMYSSMLNAMALVVDDPDAARQITMVSATQFVASAAVPPLRKFGVASDIANPYPTMVSVGDPEAG